MEFPGQECAQMFPPEKGLMPSAAGHRRDTDAIFTLIGT